MLLEGLSDGDAPGTADVEVRGPPPPIRDREVLVRDEDSEGDNREGHADGDGHEDVRGGVDAEVHAGQGDEGEDAGEGPLSSVAPTTVGHERVEGEHEEPRGRQHLLGRQCPAAPTRAQGDAKGPRASADVVENPAEELAGLDDDLHDEEMPPPAQAEQYEQQAPREELDHPPRADGRQHASRLVEPRRVDAADPAHDGVVDHCGRDCRTVQAGVEDDESCDDHRHQHDQPAQTGCPEMMGQRGRRTGRPPPGRVPRRGGRRRGRGASEVRRPFGNDDVAHSSRSRARRDLDAFPAQ